MGNRVAKKVFSDNTFDPSALEQITYYLRDASGNVMSIYEEITGQLNLTEQHMYGSSRLGMRTLRTDMLTAPVPVQTGVKEIVRGERRYELTNHLGNVLVVCSDQLTATDGDSNNQIDFYAAEVVSYSDYYPFGAEMTARSSTSDYRYNFQNQEKDDEFWGGAITFKYRIEDARLGRFFRQDPLLHKYPRNSTYAFSENRLIDGRELEGAEVHPTGKQYQAAAKWFWDTVIVGGSEGAVDGVTYMLSGMYDARASVVAGVMAGDDRMRYWEIYDSFDHKVYGFTWEDGFKAELPESGETMSFDNGMRLINGVTTLIGAGEMVAAKQGASSITTTGIKGLVDDSVDGIFTVESWMSPAQKASVRPNFANRVMGSDALKKYGPKHINFNCSVRNVELDNSTQNLIQWRDPTRPGAKPFFTYEGTDPSKLGLPSSYTEKYSVQLDRKYSFLESTAGDVDAWRPGDSGTYKGGGIQLYSPEASANAKYTKIE